MPKFYVNLFESIPSVKPIQSISLKTGLLPLVILGFSMLPTAQNILIFADYKHDNIGQSMSNMENSPTYTLHKASSRGHADHGWLNTYHSFSFASWHDPERMHFGALRVLNDDYVAAGNGFGRHPHDNMEIISIPLEGSLRHEDSMGTGAVIAKGDIQIMSAGTGILHSENNNSEADPVRFLQIWMFPNQKDLTPRYDQESFDIAEEHNQLRCVVSPTGDEGVQIHQNAWFYLGSWDKDHAQNYSLKGRGQGVYVFVLEGDLEIDGRLLSRRDAMGISDADLVQLKASSDTRFLMMDVPLQW
jgi:quercetin 2,3-dioxygenase